MVRTFKCRETNTNSKTYDCQKIFFHFDRNNKRLFCCLFFFLLTGGGAENILGLEGSIFNRKGAKTQRTWLRLAVDYKYLI